MSVLSYLNPKRAAALSIAKEIIRQSKREPDWNARRLQLLNGKDPGLYKLVLEELDKYGFRISGTG